MYSASCFEQKGVVIDISEGTAKIKIDTFSACSQCHSKNACNIFNGSMNVSVSVPDDTFTKGEEVKVIIDRVPGMKAVLLAYVLPFILVLLTLITLTILKVNELMAGLASLFILIPYFLGLYFFRNHLKKSFLFRLLKAD